MTASLLSRLSDNQPLCEEEDYAWAGITHEALLRELKMLLVSRARLSEIEEMPLLKDSVLNYGIDESFSKINGVSSRRTMMENRLKNAVSRFEPRLSQVTLTSNINDPQSIRFILRGVYSHAEITLELTWNDCTGRFYFNE